MSKSNTLIRDTVGQYVSTHHIYNKRQPIAPKHNSCTFIGNDSVLKEATEREELLAQLDHPNE